MRGKGLKSNRGNYEQKLKKVQLILMAFTYLLCLPPLILAQKASTSSGAVASPSVREVFSSGKTTAKTPSPGDLRAQFFSGAKEFSPIKSVSTPKDYIIGPSDEILVTTWDRMDSSDSLKMDDSGIIILPKVGQVTVGKLTLGKSRI